MALPALEFPQLRDWAESRGPDVSSNPPRPPALPWQELTLFVAHGFFSWANQSHQPEAECPRQDWSQLQLQIHIPVTELRAAEQTGQLSMQRLDREQDGGDDDDDDK